uniref:TPX2 C-terminal domain-containing protein n=1 Tax=Romanomermis culicivorax TaxID=13658 RepID=A0A915I9M9_ROMCU
MPEILWATLEICSQNSANKRIRCSAPHHEAIPPRKQSSSTGPTPLKSKPRRSVEPPKNVRSTTLSRGLREEKLRERFKFKKPAMHYFENMKAKTEI